MIREYKMTFKQVAGDFCDIHCEVRDGEGEWTKQGTIPTIGTIEQVRAMRIAAQERMGWHTYDIEEPDTVTFWKEL